MKTPEYSAVANFFQNTLGVGRGDVRALLKEVVKEVVREEFDRFTKTTEFRTQLRQYFDNYTRGFDLRSDVARQLAARFVVTIAPADKPTQEK